MEDIKRNLQTEGTYSKSEGGKADCGHTARNRMGRYGYKNNAGHRRWYNRLEWRC
tara:strand:- start:4365 stop:4529 length:165 start_codon:yes stop_codon:yes gene_type:complete